MMVVDVQGKVVASSRIQEGENGVRRDKKNMDITGGDVGT